ncbi:translation initiation factor 4e, putative [Entamoeba histolytica HM-1:IMSS-B]|uniref:Translation initiation factor 4e, putative n=6 Tax=Entamoeba histolytica TaxID=5759 RepID=C4LV79_ENTH1|nr:translation initiation factor 4e, putative [Entamoeba histolytica HM-1:IMSS]EMD43865.1 translation initiation factor 4e, putative [Entamoeba histolytica KU27]EMH76750.1 translation initiation factor 4e, putative [Entamoeba histolytica HM-1:IMSS-B]EMS10950.1 translation initiation factor 4e, putative [Entamoeba histolytica HM-3:IMSS]ENY60144.1 translation initiation factor 4e, putative [Entamoeba histolytica HM-1:IMSS-A]GAT92565.1 translation initiation factor 4e putative [Entamoeba histolyt|eukprot:XP_654970.1 translation initiation factor 4e, putative [Entamoeba histolytica HM-1:IMSS]
MSCEVVEHPLAFCWTFWVDNFNDKNGTFEEYIDNLKEIVSCNSIESFWKAFGCLPSLELLQDQKVSIHFMKDGIKPCWEDKENENGSTITIKCEKEATSRIWKEFLIDIISNQEKQLLDYGIVNGISVSIKKSNNLIVVWTKTTSIIIQNQIINYLITRFPELKEEDVFFKENKQHSSFASNK